MDFTTSRTIGSHINELENGYDHNYVLKRTGHELSLAAKVIETTGGRIM